VREARNSGAAASGDAEKIAGRTTATPESEHRLVAICRCAA
jgi:hypothetical protein